MKREKIQLNQHGREVTKLLAVRVPQSVFDALQAEAEERVTNRPAIVREVLGRHVERKAARRAASSRR